MPEPLIDGIPESCLPRNAKPQLKNVVFEHSAEGGLLVSKGRFVYTPEQEAGQAFDLTATASGYDDPGELRRVLDGMQVHLAITVDPDAQPAPPPEGELEDTLDEKERAAGKVLDLEVEIADPGDIGQHAEASRVVGFFYDPDVNSGELQNFRARDASVWRARAEVSDGCIRFRAGDYVRDPFCAGAAMPAVEMTAAVLRRRYPVRALGLQNGTTYAVYGGWRRVT